jgi:hypothetical protein
MKNSEADPIFKSLVILCLITYVFCAFTNVYFVSRYTVSTSHVAARRQTVITPSDHAINLVQIIDRSTIDDDHISIAKFIPVICLFFFGGLTFRKVQAILVSPFTYKLPTKQYAYISLHTFRI